MKSYLIKSFLLLSIIFVSIYAQHDESSLYKQRREVFISRMLDSSIAFFEAGIKKSEPMISNINSNKIQIFNI